MSDLLNCSAHLQSTAKKKNSKPDVVTACPWSQGYPSSVWKMRRSTTRGISLKSLVRPWLCERLPRSSVIAGNSSICDTAFQGFSSVAIISQREVLLCFFCFWPYWPTQSLINSLVILSLCCAFIKVTTASPLLRFHLRHNHMKTVILSLQFMRRANLTSLPAFISTSRLLLCRLMNPLIHSPHLWTWNIHGGYLRLQAYKFLSSNPPFNFISNSPANANDTSEYSHLGLRFWWAHYALKCYDLTKLDFTCTQKAKGQSIQGCLKVSMAKIQYATALATSYQSSPF